jgi:hypothetical protein
LLHGGGEFRLGCSTGRVLRLFLYLFKQLDELFKGGCTCLDVRLGKGRLGGLGDAIETNGFALLRETELEEVELGLVGFFVVLEVFADADELEAFEGIVEECCEEHGVEGETCCFCHVLPE